jgi:hypothetical protein
MRFIAFSKKKRIALALVCAKDEIWVPESTIMWNHITSYIDHREKKRQNCTSAAIITLLDLYANLISSVNVLLSTSLYNYMLGQVKGLVNYPNLYFDRPLFCNLIRKVIDLTARCKR